MVWAAIEQSAIAIELSLRKRSAIQRQKSRLTGEDRGCGSNDMSFVSVARLRLIALFGLRRRYIAEAAPPGARRTEIQPRCTAILLSQQRRDAIPNAGMIVYPDLRVAHCARFESTAFDPD